VSLFGYIVLCIFLCCLVQSIKVEYLAVWAASEMNFICVVSALPVAVVA